MGLRYAHHVRTGADGVACDRRHVSRRGDRGVGLLPEGMNSILSAKQHNVKALPHDRPHAPLVECRNERRQAQPDRQQAALTSRLSGEGKSRSRRAARRRGKFTSCKSPHFPP